MFSQGIFDLEEALRENTLISGANHSGKTRLACGLAHDLHTLGYQVIVFDTTSTWLKDSSLPFWARPVKFKPYPNWSNQTILAVPDTPEDSFVLDLSRLTLSDTKRVVDRVCLELWNERIDNPDRQPTFIFFEESETFLKSIRGKVAENIYRLAHVGRNIKVRCVFITTDLALIDASIIRLCSQRFHGKLNIEENSKRKFRSYYGSDYTRIACEGLQTGDFIRLQNSKLSIKSVPLYKATSTPSEYIKPVISKPKPKGIFSFFTRK